MQNKKGKVNNDTIENITRAAIRRILKNEIGKSPNIEVEIRRV